jgi:hypothetical protein
MEAVQQNNNYLAATDRGHNRVHGRVRDFMSRPRLIHIQIIAIRLRMERVVVSRIRIDSQLVSRPDGVLEFVPGDAFSQVSVTDLTHSYHAALLLYIPVLLAKSVVVEPSVSAFQ